MVLKHTLTPSAKPTTIIAIATFISLITTPADQFTSVNDMQTSKPLFSIHQSDDQISDNFGQNRKTVTMWKEISTSKKRRGRKGLSHEKQWTSDEIKRLINLWSQYKVLYKAGFIDKSKKQLALTEIAKEMNMTEIEVQKKMNSLKTYYGTVRQKSGREDLKKPNWPW